MSEQYEQEKENEQLIFQQELKTQRQFFISAISIIGILLLALVIFIQMRNNRKLKTLNQSLDTSNQQLERFNKKLEQSNLELKMFNHIASHDIKEPIRNIGGYVGLIKRKLPADLKENLSEYFDTIKQSTSQLYTLVEDFARYSAMSQNEVIEKEKVDVKVLASNVVNSIQLNVQKYNGKVAIADLPVILSSNSLLFTTLKNLIENGLKYNQSEQPTVNIDYNETATHHKIIVSDNGIGIDKAYHEQIFEMFKRLHNREEYKGSGIGLSIVKLLVEKLNGHVTINSELGKGSRFIIQLPKEN